MSFSYLLAMSSPPAEGGQGGSPVMMFGMMALIFLIFWFMIIRPQQGCDQNRNQPFEHVTQQSNRRRLLAAKTQYVGGARIMRTLGTRIGQAHQFAGDNGGRQRAEQIGEQNEADIKHNTESSIGYAA